MYVFFDNLHNFLNTRDNYIIIAIIFTMSYCLAYLLRFIMCMSFRSSLFMFRLDSKEIKIRDDIKKIKNSLLKKTINEYIRTAEKSVSRIPTASIIEKNITGMSLLGWRFVSVGSFTESLENGLLLVGLILAVVFGDFAFMYGTLAVAGFLFAKLIAAFFDYKTARLSLSDEMLIFIEREIGQFFAADAGSSVNRLKNDLTESVNKQTSVLKTAIEEFGQKISSVVGESLISIHSKFENRLAALDEPLNKWSESITQAEKTQSMINDAAEKLNEGINGMNTASVALCGQLAEHNRMISEPLMSLASSAATAGENQETYLSQLKYIERNQLALDNTLQLYETALQNMTRQLGDGLGAFLQMHAQNAALNVNEVLQANVNKIVGSNQEILTRITALFDQLKEQNREISSHLLTLHEKTGS